jgi:rhodanese-related sulfurtransferase
MYAVSEYAISKNISFNYAKEVVLHSESPVHFSAFGWSEIVDIEEKVPDQNVMIICHCGGGGRSALAAETLQKMGYKNVRSMAGGLRAWKAAGLPTTT